MKQKLNLRFASLGVAGSAGGVGTGGAAWGNLARADKGAAAGAVVGGVVGNAVGGGTLGTVGGAVVGGVVGREAAKR